MASAFKRQRNTCAFVIAALVLPAALPAAEGDDTLRYYLSKSSLVVSGDIIDGPRIVSTETSVNRYSFRLKVTKIIKGGIHENALKDGLPVGTIHPETNKAESLAFVKKGERVIVFLRERQDKLGGWEGADPWFGVQQYNEIMEDALERLYAE